MSAWPASVVLASALLPPWIDGGSTERRTGAEEVELRATPDIHGARRATIAAGRTVRVYAKHKGPGCDGAWVMVGPEAWACSDNLKAHDGRQDAPESEPKFFFVQTESTPAYASFERAGEDTPDAEFERGFGVSIVKTRAKDGTNWSLTTKGMWVQSANIVQARISKFLGTKLQGTLDVAWAKASGARARKEDNDGVATKLPPRTAVRVAGAKGEGKAERLLVAWNDATGAHTTWLLPSELRRPRALAPEPTWSPTERWVDVSLKDQTLVAYEGAAPVYATLISSGKGNAGSPFETPKGHFHVWAKIRAITMDNLDEPEAETYYSVEDVPYVQFFSNGVALHGAYWHDLFGQRHSHGCVNLSVPDAKFLFDFANPALPPGWSAAHPYVYDAGLRVIVHD